MRKKRRRSYAWPAWLLLLASPAVAGQPELRTAIQDFAVEIIVADDEYAYRVFNPTATVVPAAVSEQVNICWENEVSTSTVRVYISTFSTVDETRYGWMIHGSGTTSISNERGPSCATWGPNVPVFVWVEDGQASQRLRFRRDR